MTDLYYFISKILGIEDLEDALQVQCARKVKADYITTRDDKLKKLISNAISPVDFVEILDSD